MEESGVTGVSIWAESHAAIHTWDEDNYYAFDAFSCRDFRPRDALRLLLTHFDIETLNCVNLFRYQRSIPRVSHFQVNASWEVVVDGRMIGDLDSVDFRTVCPGGPAAEERAPETNPAAPPGPRRPASRDGAPTGDGAREKKRPPARRSAPGVRSSHKRSAP
jgi:hypothetical protein